VSSAERVKQIMQRQPTVVCGTPTYLLHLAEIAEQEGIDIRQAGVRVLAGGGEPGLSVPVTRDRLKSVWGVEQLYDAYGVGEALFIGQSCAQWGGGVHVIEDVCHSYTVNPETGEPTADGEVGEHVVTSYTHFTQPFIKYRTHDLVQIDQHPNHGCGWTWKHMPGSVLGRADFMVTIRGVNVYPTAVENLIGDLSDLTNHYELHISRQSGMDRMLVKVEAASHQCDHQQLGDELGRHFREQLGVRLETEVLPPGSLPRYQLKTKRIFDTRADGERPVISLGRDR
jgi:phenylacetate-CoA ligase